MYVFPTKTLIKVAVWVTIFVLFIIAVVCLAAIAYAASCAIDGQDFTQAGYNLADELGAGNYDAVFRMLKDNVLDEVPFIRLYGAVFEGGFKPDIDLVMGDISSASLTSLLLYLICRLLSPLSRRTTLTGKLCFSSIRFVASCASLFTAMLILKAIRVNSTVLPFWALALLLAATALLLQTLSLYFFNSAAGFKLSFGRILWLGAKELIGVAADVLIIFIAGILLYGPISSSIPDGQVRGILMLYASCLCAMVLGFIKCLAIKDR